MDLNYVLLWMVLTALPLALWRIRGLRWDGIRELRILYTILLAITLALKGYVPQWAGDISAVLFVFAGVIPSQAARFGQRAYLRQDFASAAKYYEVLRWLRPFKTGRGMPPIMRALALAQKGQRPEALRRLRSYEGDESALGWLAVTQLYILEARWDDLKQWLQSRQERITRVPSLLPIALRALGETGDLGAMLQRFEEWRPTMGSYGMDLIRSQAQLYVAAFCGRLTWVTAILEGPLKNLSDPAKRLWLLTARMAAGDAAAVKELRQSLPSAGLVLAPQFEYRMSFPARDARSILSAADGQVVRRMEQDMEHDQRYGTPFGDVQKPWMTYSLVGINVATFLLEGAMGGATNMAVLRRLGALDLSDGFHRRYGSLLFACFLHFGWVHLVMNMVALLILGPFVERKLGKFKFLIVYLLCGVGAFACIAALHHWTGFPNDVAVGASGAIMGMVGATGAIMLKGALTDGASQARQRLKGVILVVGCQAIFDLMTPQVSFVGHLTGCIIGFALVSLVNIQEWLLLRAVKLRG